MASIDEILENFALLDDWEDRYRYDIELGNELEPLSDDEHAAENKVRGCASQVWFVSKVEPCADGKPHIYFRGDSDAHIVRGLIAILVALYSGKAVAEILYSDPQPLFSRMGLKDHLTQQRSN